LGKDARITKLAKNLRKRPTDVEDLLWLHLKAKNMAGLKFRRQQPIEGFIVDFVCFENKLVIELDGGQHLEAKAVKKDKERDEWRKSRGYRILRIHNNEVFENLEGVLEFIWDNCKSPSPLSPPVKGGELRK
jgi:very-short-patch-repair endonuclease